MDGSTTQNLPRSERCRKNAQDKSARKRQAAFAALAALQREGRPITKTAVARRAGTSVVFLRAHPDLRLAIEEADRTRTDPPPAPSEQTKDHLVAALRRRLDTLKQTLEAREATLRDKQREIDQLYGKLATGSLLRMPNSANNSAMPLRAWRSSANRVARSERCFLTAKSFPRLREPHSRSSLWR